MNEEDIVETSSVDDNDQPSGYILVDKSTNLVWTPGAWLRPSEFANYQDAYLIIPIDDSNSNVKAGWLYLDGVFSGPEITEEEIIEQNKLTQYYAINNAEGTLKFLDFKLKMLEHALTYEGVEGKEDFAITPEEKATLIRYRALYPQYMDYFLLISHIVNRPDWPLVADFPTAPDPL